MRAVLFRLKRSLRLPDNIRNIQNRALAYAAGGCLFIGVILKPEGVNASPIERVNSITHGVNVGIVERTLVNEDGCINRDCFVAGDVEPILFGEWLLKFTRRIACPSRAPRDCVLSKMHFAGVHDRQIGEFFPLQITPDISCSQNAGYAAHIGYGVGQSRCCDGVEWPVLGNGPLNFYQDKEGWPLQSNCGVSGLFGSISGFFVGFNQEIGLFSGAFKLFKLTAHRFELPVSRFDEAFISGNQIVRLLSSTFHLDQLIGHNFELGFENQILQSTNQNDSDGKDSYKDGGIRSSARSTILGCGAAIMKIAFDLLDAPYNPIGLRLSGWGIGGVAGLLIGQGTILLLTGNWLP
jgi:hypothetical protein